MVATAGPKCQSEVLRAAGTWVGSSPQPSWFVLRLRLATSPWGGQAPPTSSRTDFSRLAAVRCDDVWARRAGLSAVPWRGVCAAPCPETREPSSRLET
eukprot:3290710-Prymnesium_polylepis.1